MGNFCNCFIPVRIEPYILPKLINCSNSYIIYFKTKNIHDEDYDFEISYPNEVRRRKEDKTDRKSSKSSLLNSPRRRSFEPCYNQFSDDDEQSINKSIFTISSPMSPETGLLLERSISLRDPLLDTIELSYKQMNEWSKRRRQLKIWSLTERCSSSSSSSIIREENECSTSLLMIDDLKKEALSLTESFDSGCFTSGSSSLVDLSNPITTTSSSSYLIIEQQKPLIRRRKSVFNYLFDFSDSIRDVLFEWPLFYARKLAEMSQFIAKPTGNMLAYRPIRTVRMNKDKSLESATTSSHLIVDKPLSIMSLLSKINLFNMFQAATTTVKSVISSTSPLSTGFNPLREFFLRLFDINFY